MAGAGNKSEKPTVQRLRKAREQGQFLSARGMLTAVQFIAAILLLSHFLPPWLTDLQDASAVLLQRAMSSRSMTEADWLALLSGLLYRAIFPVLYFGGIVMAVGLAGQLATTQMGFSLSKLAPNFNRLNPMSRLKELPGQNFKSLSEGVMLIVVLGLAIHAYFQSNAEALLRLPFQPVFGATAQVGSMLLSLMWRAAVIFVVFGAVDLFRSYRKHMSSLKMSKEEIKQENKQNEGDPQIRNRIKRLRREILRRKMMKEVPIATAVIVNPTHYAVAIRYESESMPCPVVVAKGKNWLALRIRQIAIENEVPIIDNPPLARGLYGAVKVGQAISPEFYRAIAEILAYVYKMMGREVQTAR